jgi:hypothetical protein
MKEEQWLRLDQARHAVRARKYATGAPQLERLLCELPDSPQAWGLLAICYDALGRAEQAESAARRSVALAPHDAVLQRNLGALLWNRGDRGAAEAVFAQWPVAPPEDVPPAEDAPPTTAADQPAAEAEQPESADAPDEWSPFLDEGPEEADGGPARLEPEIPEIPPVPPSLVRKKKEPVVLPPFSLSTCFRVGLRAAFANLGEVGGMVLACVGCLFGLAYVSWSMSAALQFYVGREAASVPWGPAFVVATLVLAGLSYVGVRLADSALTGDNPPVFDDLWAVFSEWGLVGALALTRTALVAVALGPAVALAAAGEGWFGCQAGALLGLPLVPLGLWVAARTWFAQHLPLATETEYVESLTVSWEITGGRGAALPFLVLATTALTLLGPGIALGGIALLGVGLPAAGAVAAGLLVTVVCSAVASAVAGAAFRLLYEETYPEDDTDAAV